MISNKSPISPLLAKINKATGLTPNREPLRNFLSASSCRLACDNHSSSASSAIFTYFASLRILSYQSLCALMCKKMAASSRHPRKLGYLLHISSLGRGSFKRTIWKPASTSGFKYSESVRGKRGIANSGRLSASGLCENFQCSTYDSLLKYPPHRQFCLVPFLVGCPTISACHKTGMRNAEYQFTSRLQHTPYFTSNDNGNLSRLHGWLWGAYSL
jgi:hypothetical protein